MLGLGLTGAFLAQAIGAPMPFMMGALALVGLYAAWRTAASKPEAHFPNGLRKLFVALIGVMIGASFTRDLMQKLPGIWPSLLVMVAFIAAALAGGYLLFRRLGGYDPVTAIYSAMPGGLIEAVTLGEAAGGNARVLALQHFARIVVVVVAVPFLYLLWSGNAVGSAAGQSFETRAWTAIDVGAIVGVAVLGIWLGPKLKLPAGHLFGPLVLSAALHGFGLLSLSSPAWFLAVSQLVVGTGLGTSFAGARMGDLIRAFGLALIYVVGVMALGYGIAIGLSHVTAFDFDTLFVSFAPGGVTEMGLIALSLGISPVIVTTHHVFRIGFTVGIAGLLAKLVSGARQKP